MIATMCNRKPSRRLPPGATFIVLLGAWLPLGAAANCGELPPTKVEVTLLETPASTNFQYSYRQLRALTDDYRQTQETLGLARGNASTRFAIEGRTWRAPNAERECSSFEIRLSYGFSPITVYVGREFAKGSCAHDEIFRHELQHVETYQQHARAIREEITRTLKQRFETSTPWYGARGETAARLQRELDERWLPYVQRMLDRVKVAQRKIDSPEEYARVAASCNGEIKAVLSRP